MRRLQELEAYVSPETIALLKRHRCAMCGECCRWAGYVYVSPDDIDVIATTTKVPYGSTFNTCCMLIHWKWNGVQQYRIALRRRREDGACVFLRRNQCGINGIKPLVCRAGPAGWHWLSRKPFFQYYVDHCPGFHLDNRRRSMMDPANELFMETWRLDANLSHLLTLDSLAEFYRMDVKELHQLVWKEIL